MKYELVSEKFGKWAKYFKPFIESEAFDDIFRTLKARKGKVSTAPESSDLFRAFSLCDPDNLKVIIVGVSPYAQFVDGKCIADGLTLSCSKSSRLQLPLELLYTDLEETYSDDIDVDMVHEKDLKYLADQGVLLYNIALTVQADKPGSDVPVWKEFDKFFWEEVINKYFRGICCVFMGETTHRSAKYLLPMVHYPFLLTAPGTTGNTWDSKGTWLRIDTILQQNNGIRVKWYKKKGDDENLPEFVTNYHPGSRSPDDLSDMPWEKE